MQEPQETRAGSLVWEDPLEEGMATHSSTLVWEISWTEEPGGLQSIAMSSHLKGLRVGGCRREQIAYCLIQPRPLDIPLEKKQTDTGRQSSLPQGLKSKVNNIKKHPDCLENFLKVPKIAVCESLSKLPIY